MQPTTDRESCSALVLRLYAALDAHEYSGLEALFVPHARMTRLGHAHEGLPAIGAAFARRPADLHTRHLLSNLLIDGDSSSATGRFTMTVVRATGAPGTARPLVTSGPWRVSDVKVRFEHDSYGWRICELATEPQFEFDPLLHAGERSQ